MPTPTYTPIASTTLSSAQTTVTFDVSAVQNYRDLILVIRATGVSYGFANMRFNSDSGSNYSWVAMAGNGSTANSTSGTGTQAPIAVYAGGATSSDVLTTITQIFDYTQSKHKSYLSRGNSVTGGDANAEALAGRWANTGAITSISITGGGSNFASGSTFSLYGVIA